MLHFKVFISLIVIMAFVVLSWTVVMAAPSPTPSADSIVVNGIAQEMADETPTPEPRHPVADKIAAYFDVEYSEVADLHASGIGFGVIARAYFLAEELGLTVNDIIEMKQSGMGWGQFMHEYGVHPGSYNLGRIMSGKEKGGPPDHAGPPEGKGGQPDHAGPPEGKGGPPDHAGPPEGKGGGKGGDKGK